MVSKADLTNAYLEAIHSAVSDLNDSDRARQEAERARILEANKPVLTKQQRFNNAIGEILQEGEEKRISRLCRNNPTLGKMMYPERFQNESQDKKSEK